MVRASKKAYYLNIAAEVAKRSTCLRRQYGAVITKDDIVLATGYNGAPRGEPNCCDVGSCWREEHNIPHGEQYEKCVVGETRIRTLDNENPQIKDVVGKEIDVFAIDREGNIVPAKGRNIRCTGIRNDIYQIRFDDGTTFRCTGDHKIMLRDLSYREAKDLGYGDSVMPYYGNADHISNTWHERSFKPTKEERERWRKTCKTSKTPIMYLVYKFYHEDFDPSAIIKNGELLLHHVNGKHHDNTPENLRIVTRRWHSAHHGNLSKQTKEQRVQNAKKATEAQRRKIKENPEFAEMKSKTGQKNMRALWAEEEWRIKSIERCRRNFAVGREKSNRDPAAIRNRAIAKTRKALSLVIFMNGGVRPTEDNYEELRYKAAMTYKNIAFPKIDKILKWFDSFELALDAAETWNHKVVSVEKLDICVPVYDMEVPDYHNFGVYLNEGTGIFVHNCVAVHAEANAIISAARRDMIGSTLYLAGWEDGKRIENPEPCEICAKLIKNAGIKEVIVCE